MFEQNSLFGQASALEQAKPSGFTLREYQQAALDKILWAMKLQGNDLIILPTGAGKSIVIAKIAETLDREILILQPSKEILEQNLAKLAQYVSPSQIGVFSASMNRKDIAKFTFATIQSIYTKPELFDHIGLVIIDECHLVNQKNTGSMFASFLKGIGNPKVIGTTATPYRNVQGYHKFKNLYGEEYLDCKVTLKLINRMKSTDKKKPFFWDRLLFNINNAELVEQGFLCPLKYESPTLIKHSEIKLNKSESDFDIDDYEKKTEGKNELVIQTILEKERVCNSVLVFCSSIRKAQLFSAEVPGSAFVTGQTPAKERDRIINGFKDGTIKTVFNVGVLTTGFDHPALDCIVLLRPTRSLSLYYQMCGRGVRIFPGKTHCTVVDFTSTVQNLGRIETIKLVKEDKWELVTETGHWHNRMLYSYQKELAPREQRSEAAKL